MAMKPFREEAAFTLARADSRAEEDMSMRATPEAPSRAKATEVERPIPEAAPVTTWGMVCQYSEVVQVTDIKDGFGPTAYPDTSMSVFPRKYIYWRA